jgi:hypothetical protein
MAARASFATQVHVARERTSRARRSAPCHLIGAQLLCDELDPWVVRAVVLTLRDFDESEQQQLPPCTFQRAAAAALQLRQCFTCNEANSPGGTMLRSPRASIVGAR